MRDTLSPMSRLLLRRCSVCFVHTTTRSLCRSLFICPTHPSAPIVFCHVDYDTFPHSARLARMYQPLCRIAISARHLVACIHAAPLAAPRTTVVYEAICDMHCQTYLFWRRLVQSACELEHCATFGERLDGDIVVGVIVSLRAQTPSRGRASAYD